MRKITSIIIHCSDTPNGLWITAENINDWHAEREFMRNAALIGHNQPKLLHIGYHFVIYANGAVVIGRGLNEVGAHAGGFNHDSIGVCLVGRDQYSADQWAALSGLVTALKHDYTTITRVIGHHEVAAHKTCPGFDVRAWLANHMRPEDKHIYSEATAAEA